jgi:hypothetical protein
LTEPRLPVLPRIGFTVLTIAFVVLLAGFVLLFFVLPDERWTFLLPVGGMLFGLSWVRGARRRWIDQHRAPVPAPAGPATLTTAPEA